MGTQLRMNKSVKECATYIFKLHSAIISSWREKAYKNDFVYPVMDAKEFEAKIIKLLQKHRIVNEVNGFEGNIQRDKMRDEFYALGNKEGYIVATLGNAEYSD